jgi:AraC family transcriptional regulator, arabinose operon regulatory protein
MRTAAEIERSDRGPDVLLVRRISRPGRDSPIHGPSDRHWTVIYGLAGERVFRMRGSSVTLGSDSLLLFRRESALQPRATKQPEVWDCVTACFTAAPEPAVTQALERVGDEIYRVQIAHPATRQRIRDAFARLLSDEHARVAAGAVRTLGVPPAATRQDEDAMRRELMLMTMREILLVAGHDRVGRLDLDPRIREALEIMAHNLTAPHSLRSLGAAVDLSPSRFGHLFGVQLGVSPVRALRLMRLRQAALQLRYTSESVERIAEETGFASLSHLSREFRRYFGMSPRSYRIRTD